jgi:hypothetical protein
MEFFMNTALIIICALSLLGSVVATVSFYFSRKSMHDDLEALRRKVVDLEVKNMTLETQYNGIVTQYHDLLEKLAKQ